MIHILGNGDLSKEFISFSNFDSKNVKIYSQAEFSEKDFKNGIYKDDKVFITISDPNIRKKVFEYLISIGLTPDTYIYNEDIINKLKDMPDSTVPENLWFLNGELDELPEQAFYLVGNIDEAIAKAETLK